MIRASAAWVALVALSLGTACAFAQGKPASEELDVTMQIIVDPDAKLPDEVVRRIPLPAPKPNPAASARKDAAGKGQERASEAGEFGRETAERAKERNREAAEQREQARRSAAEERRRRPDPPRPPERPPPPSRP